MSIQHMGDPRAAKISKFRDKHERQLLSLMAQAITCSSCLAEGNAALLRTEMDSLSGQILDLVEDERRTQKRAAKTSHRPPGVVPMIAVVP